MNLYERLTKLSERARENAHILATEEATKNALVMPFIQALGYDVFDPTEVVPEYTLDVGIKRGEKIDYAIMRGDQVMLLIEAKRAGATLTIENASQLYRYFSVSHARIAVLTDGITWKFFSDLDEPNKMDQAPFMVLDLAHPKESTVRRVSMLSKDEFELERMLETASDLKHLNEIKAILRRQFDEPDQELVKFFFSHVCPGKSFVQSAREPFRVLVREAFSDIVRDRVSNRLRSALIEETGDLAPGIAIAESISQPPGANEGSGDDGTAEEERSVDIVTTEEELDGFRIVRAIICGEIPVARIFYRDTKSYFGVLIDDNNRRPICRLHFNRSQKYLGLLDEQKVETRHPIQSVSDLYGFAEPLRAAARRYTATEPTAPES